MDDDRLFSQMRDSQWFQALFGALAFAALLASAVVEGNDLSLACGLIACALVVFSHALAARICINCIREPNLTPIHMKSLRTAQWLWYASLVAAQFSFAFLL